MEQGPGQAEVVMSSVVGRKQFVRLHRRLQRGELGPGRISLGVLALVAVVALVAVRQPFGAVGSPTFIMVLLALTLGIGIAFWRQPYRLWHTQADKLAAPGNVTLDDEGVHRVVSGGMDARIPWSDIELGVDAGDVLGLRITRYSWILLPLPDDPQLAADVRDVVTQHTSVSR